MSNAMQCVHFLKILGNKRFYSNGSSVPPGEIYDKKPIKVLLEAGKTYWWCACGRSKKQPFCDGTHKIPELKIPQKPVKIDVIETKEYFLCLCKQTLKAPFCDGTHKGEKVQKATSIVEKLQTGK